MENDKKTRELLDDDALGKAIINASVKIDMIVKNYAPFPPPPQWGRVPPAGGGPVLGNQKV